LRKAGAARGLQPVGWQGIELRLPEGWNLVKEEGARQKGSMGFASASSTLELKWEEIKRKKVASVEAIAENFIKGLRKSVKDLKVLGKNPVKVFGHNGVSFHFESEQEGYGFTWYCDEHEKMFIGIFVFRPAELEAPKLVFRRLLESIRCHSPEGWERWSILGFSFRAPSTMRLARAPLEKALMGRNSLMLHAEEQHPFLVERTEVYLDYWSAADVIFEKTYRDPKKWFKEFYEEGLRKRYRGRMEKGRFQASKVGGHKAEVLKTTFRSGRVEQSVTENRTHIWYCPETNRVYALTLTRGQRKNRLYLGLFKRFLSARRSEASSKRVLDGILASFSCH